MTNTLVQELSGLIQRGVDTLTSYCLLMFPGAVADWQRQL